MRRAQTVALVDWNWAGHHPTYLANFCSALLENGVRVVPCCPAPHEFLQLFRETPAGKLPENDLLEAPLRVQFAPTRNIRPYRLRPVEQAVRHFWRLQRILREWERTRGYKIDLVFFGCIYDFQFEWLRLAEPIFRFPWSGLYLHARSFRLPNSPIPGIGRLPCPEKIFTLRSMHSVAVLDEGAVSPMRELTAGRPVVVFPDFTDERLAPKNDPVWGLANKIRSFAGARKVVVLFGHLQKTKGLLELIRAAGDSKLQDVCFAFVGDVSWQGLSDASRNEVRRGWEQLPNVITYLQRVGDEATLNSLVASADIVFAAYTDFPNSSGVLTKAAVFKRPVIVSDGHLMAERTRKYGLGEIVPEGDVDAIVTSLRRLAHTTPDPASPENPGWLEYHSVHSYERLTRAFAEIIG